MIVAFFECMCINSTFLGHNSLLLIWYNEVLIYAAEHVNTKTNITVLEVIYEYRKHKSRKHTLQASILFILRDVNAMLSWDFNKILKHKSIKNHRLTFSQQNTV